MPKGAERKRSRRDQGAILSNGKNHWIAQEGELQVIWWFSFYYQNLRRKLGQQIVHFSLQIRTSRFGGNRLLFAPSPHEATLTQHENIQTFYQLLSCHSSSTLAEANEGSASFQKLCFCCDCYDKNAQRERKRQRYRMVRLCFIWPQAKDVKPQPAHIATIQHHPQRRQGHRPPKMQLTGLQMETKQLP